MPLTDRGKAILERLPAGAFSSTGSTGCEIVRHEELCVGCGRCVDVCHGNIGMPSVVEMIRRATAASSAGGAASSTK